MEQDYNRKIQELLDKYVTKDKYKEFKPMLDEIIRRRAIEFNFSLERMEREINSMVENLDSIEFASDEELNREVASTEEAVTTACYVGLDKKILINRDNIEREEKKLIALYSEKYGKLDQSANQALGIVVGFYILAGLTHEVYHAIAKGKDDLNGIEHYESFGESKFWVGKYLNEVFTESASSRTTEARKLKNIRRGYSDTYGYQSTTFMTNMTAYALGVSEKELLSNGLSNYEELHQFFTSRFPGEDKETINYEYALMEASAGACNTQLKLKKYEENARILGTLFNNQFRIATTRIACNKKDISLEYLGEIFYTNYKMNEVMCGAIQDFAGLDYINKDSLSTILERSEQSRKKLTSQLVDLYEIFKRKITPEHPAFGYAMRGDLKTYIEYYDKNNEFSDYKNMTDAEKIQELYQLGQKTPSGEFFNYISKIREDDFESQNNWDKNSELYLYEIYKKSRLKNDPSLEDDGR